MVAVTAGYTAATNVTRREDLKPFLTIIDPTECVGQANISEVDIDNAESHEWFQDSLNTPSTDPYADGIGYDLRVGSTASSNDVTTRVKLLTRAHIRRRHFHLSNRMIEENHAGVDDEIGHQTALRMEDLRLDCEKILFDLNAPVASASASTAPETAGIPSWLKTNTSRASGGQDPTISSNEPANIANVDDTGNERALSEADFLEVLREIYDNSSAKPDLVVMSPEMKENWSSYMFSGNSRIATPYQDMRGGSGGARVLGAVDDYVGNFGTYGIAPSRFSRPRDVLVLDPTLWEIGVYRDYQLHEMGLRGDAREFMVLRDFAVISLDEKGSGIVADIDESLAMVA